ncbi:glycosyl hydrolase-related protein [Pannonibacter phragmitetus]|uniref:glycosyl hydrolase-related protein n=1 Tax=Pannonibacter phragmitetus TaxID=121719 RepID=UPI003D2F13C1
MPFTLEGEGLCVEAVKQAEDGDAIILRLWEVPGARRKARLRLDPVITAVARTDLLEREPEALTVEDGAVSLSLAPFEILTLSLSRSAVATSPIPSLT